MTPSPSLIWFLIGVGFIVAELTVPVFILIFFALGCWVVALATWLTDPPLSGQVLVFIVSSMILLFSLRKFCMKTFKGNTLDNLDDDYAEVKIGKTAVVTRAIQPNKPGEIKVMGSFWRAVADVEIDEGRSVRIESRESADGLTFKVKPI